MFYRSAVCTLNIVAALLLSTAAHAQLFRAYLASDGSDANPCTLAQPCRLLPAALAAAGGGGEIWMLDSANYNIAPLNIAQSVTILAVPGAVGSVVGVGGSAINIDNNYGHVVLRNLVIIPLSGNGSANGINIAGNGNRVTIYNCLIANWPENGISMMAGGTFAHLLVADSTIRGNGYAGIQLYDTVGGAGVTVTRTVISHNFDAGVFVFGRSINPTTADIAYSTLVGNGSHGVQAYSNYPSGVVNVSVSNSLVTGSGVGLYASTSSSGASVSFSASNNTVSSNNRGIYASDSGSKMWVSGNTVSNNFGAGFFNDGALFESAGNNAVRNNGAGLLSGPITVVAME